MGDDVLRALELRPDGIYMDATFGRGGHARALLSRLGPRGRLVVIDRDPDAVRIARGLAASDARVSAYHAAFSTHRDIVSACGLLGKLDGMLLDLGVSSPQLDQPERGFSFRARGPLDMRMDPTVGTPLSAWLAEAREGEIADVIREYGEERFARGIARAIVAARDQAPIDDTLKLAEIVVAAVPARARARHAARVRPDVHPATRTFQAFRIFVNRELDELRSALAGVLDVLAPRGRLVVLTFHSLEDRIVKRFMRRHARPPVVDKHLPPIEPEVTPRMRIIGKAQRAGGAEVKRNPRARSAMLRVAEKRA